MASTTPDGTAAVLAEATSAGAVHADAVHAGAVLAEATSAGAVQAGAVQAGAVPAGGGFAGAVPAGAGFTGSGFTGTGFTRTGRRRGLGQPSARSLLLTLLGEYVLPDREPAWTATLVRALAQFGVSEKAARQAIARTSGEGWISPLRRGRLVQWQLTDAGGRLLTDGAKRIYSFGAGARAWDGRWLILMVSLPDGGRDRRHQLRARLNWAGFGLLPTGAWVCPDPAREAEAAGILADLGLLETSMSFVATNGTVGAQAGIAALAWDLDAVEIRYKRFIEQFEPLVAGTDEAMLTAQTMLVHEWRRFPFLDPQLPHDLLPPAWLGTQAAALFAARHAAWRDGARQRWQALARAV